MIDWEEIYQKNLFLINTNKPSLVVEALAGNLSPSSRILDLGCGNGRNTVFLADKGHHVDAIDIADLKFIRKLTNGLGERIKFIHASIFDINYPNNYYDLAIGTRLLQYFSEEELTKLFKLIYPSLRPNGIFTATFAISGGIFKETNLKLKKYKHRPKKIISLAKRAGFSNIRVKIKDTRTSYVLYDHLVKAATMTAMK